MEVDTIRRLMFNWLLQIPILDTFDAQLVATNTYSRYIYPFRVLTEAILSQNSLDKGGGINYNAWLCFLIPVSW